MNNLRDGSISDLVKEIKSVLPGISEDMIMEFLMGEENKYMDSILRNKTKNQKVAFDKGKREALARSTDWSEERFKSIVGVRWKEGDYQRFVKVAKSYSEKCIGKTWKYKNDSDFIKGLVSYLWLRTPYPDEAFLWAPVYKKNYISLEEKEKELLEKISKESLVFVTGKAASGKRKLVNNYLQSESVVNYVNAEVISNVCGTKVFVEYILSKEKEVSLGEFLGHCEWRGKEDYIILTWSYFNKDEIAPLLCWIKEHETKVIVITRMAEVPDGNETVKIENWPENLLAELLGDKLKRNTTNEEKKIFFELFQHNPFLVDIFSKYLIQSKETIAVFCRNTEKEGETEQIALSKGSKLHCSYRSSNTDNKRKEQNALPIATSLVKCLLPCLSADIRLLCELIVWTRTPIEKEFVVGMGGFKEESIEDLIAKNYLVCVDKTKIQMYPVFVWAIDALEVELTENESEEISKQIKTKFEGQEILFIENGIQSGFILLDSMKGNEKCPTAYIQYFYQVIENIICRYHRLYSANKNLTNDNKKKYYDQWTRFLECAVGLIREMGHRDMSEWVQEKIYTIYKKKEKYDNATEEQDKKRKREEFNQKLMRGTLKNEDWNNTTNMVKHGDVFDKRPLLDVFTYLEIMDIVCDFPKTGEDRYICSKRGTVNLLDEYIHSLEEHGMNDDMEYLYTSVKFYFKALYEDRKYIKDAKTALSKHCLLCDAARDSDSMFRGLVYYCFFEFLFFWKDISREPMALCNMFGDALEEVKRNLTTKSYSLCTTSTAILCERFMRPFVPTRLVEEGWESYLRELQTGQFDFFQKLKEVNKYQYQIDDESYFELEEAIQKSKKGISEVYKKPYIFKENE